MQIVKGQNDRPGRRPRPPERIDTGDKLAGERFAAQLVARRVGRNAEQRLQHAALFAALADQRVVDAGANGFGRVAGHDAQHAAQQADAQAIGLIQLVGVGRGRGDLRAERRGQSLQSLVHQARLAQPGVAAQEDDVAAAVAQPIEDAAQQLPLPQPVDQRRVEPHLLEAARLDARAAAQDAIGRHWRSLALDLDAAQRLDLELPGHGAQGVFGDLNRAGQGGLLHARGDVDGVAQSTVLQPQVRADRADDDQAGIDTHAHVQLAGTRRQVGAKLGHAGDDLQRGQHGAAGVVLVGDGRAEEGQQPVAHEPGDGALIAVDGAHHALERAVDDVAPLFGVELLGQGGGAFDVAEEHSDHAALTGHCAGAAGGAELVL